MKASGEEAAPLALSFSLRPPVYDEGAANFPGSCIPSWNKNLCLFHPVDCAFVTKFGVLAIFCPESGPEILPHPMTRRVAFAV